MRYICFFFVMTTMTLSAHRVKNPAVIFHLWNNSLSCDYKYHGSVNDLFHGQEMPGACHPAIKEEEGKFTKLFYHASDYWYEAGSCTDVIMDNATDVIAFKFDDSQRSYVLKILERPLFEQH